jgi:ubiquinone/menaquinone biosynthesis C-methylase UbiE
MKFFLLLMLLLGCSQGTGHNHANHHMHKSSHADLIKRFEDPERDLVQKPKEVIKHLAPLEGRVVIDIGVGSGYFAKHFLEAGALVTGADVDEKFLAHVRERFSDAEFKTKKIAFDDPMMGEAQFDLAFTSNTYHHIDHRVSYLKKVRAGLKSDGRFVVFDFKKEGETKSGPPLAMRIDKTQVISELKEAGFSHITTHTQEFEQHYLIIATK